MSVTNHMTVKELAGFLNGVVEAGHGDSEVYICLDHGAENRDDVYDLGIDKVGIYSLDGDVFVAIESYLFDDGLHKLMNTFGYELD